MSHVTVVTVFINYGYREKAIPVQNLSFFSKCYQGDIKKQLAGFHKNAIGYVQSGHTLFCIFSKTPPLPRQRELDAQTKVLRRRRIAAARKHWRVRLTIIVETHREQLAERVICRETQLQGIVATARTAHHRGDVSHDGCLLAEAEVEAQVEVVVGAIRTIATA